jgi:hypothetical protein
MCTGKLAEAHTSVYALYNCIIDTETNHENISKYDFLKTVPNTTTVRSMKAETRQQGMAL